MADEPSTKTGQVAEYHVTGGVNPLVHVRFHGESDFFPLPLPESQTYVDGKAAHPGEVVKTALFAYTYLYCKLSGPIAAAYPLIERADFSFSPL